VHHMPEFQAPRTKPSGADGPLTTSEISMRYRGIEYTVVQGIGRDIWNWSVWLDADHTATGKAAIKSAAVAEAERAIDLALAPKKLRLVPPKTER